MPKIILAARGRITTHHLEQLPNRSWKHRGVDQGHGDGEAVDLEIRAPAAGKVIAVGRDGTYGQRIIILHDDFTVSLLAHHARQFVKVGDRVEQRQLIAEMGSTGTIYVHNHQEYRDKFGAQLDPLEHLATLSSLSALDTITITEPAIVPEEDDTMKPRLIRIAEVGNAAHNQVWFLFPDRAVFTTDGVHIRDLGRAWGVFKPAEKWEGKVDDISLAEFNRARDEINANRTLTRTETVAALLSGLAK